MALKMPKWFWAGVYVAQRAIQGLLGLKEVGLLEKRKPGADDFEGNKDKTPKGPWT